MAAAVVVAGGAIAAAATFLPGKHGTVPPGRTPPGVAATAHPAGTSASSTQASALAASLQLSELSKSSYAAKFADVSSHVRRAGGGSAAAAARRLHRKRRRVPVYLNPLRAITGLIPQRIDMGADFAGTGPIYPIGDAVITSATGSSSGWPGGGWITYHLTNGPAAGLVVYVAEDVRPTVSVGEKVTPATEIASMFSGSAGIETGWAMADGASAESQLAEAGGISGAGPFPTKVGVSFDALLVALGVPAAPNLVQASYGILPANYPATWPGV
jgi:hypothetical protein